MISVFLLWALRSLSRCAAAYHHVGSLSVRRYSRAESKLWCRSPLSSQGLRLTNGGARVGNTPLTDSKCFGATAWPQRA